MSGSPKRAAKRRPSFLVRLAKGLYITLFILSLIVVAGYAALNIFAPKPTVDGQVTIPPKTENSAPLPTAACPPRPPPTAWCSIAVTTCSPA